jgi:hypothetical protein
LEAAPFVFCVFLAECDFFVWRNLNAECVFFYETLAGFWFVVVPEFAVVDVVYDFGGVFDSGFFLYFSF